LTLRVEAHSTESIRFGLRSLVRLSTASYATLDQLYPGCYPRVIVSGEGAYLVDADGRRLFDSGAHMGACQIGHGRREVAERIAAQASVIEFTTLDAGLAHPHALELAERLAPLLPLAGPPLFLFGVSGSEANETAFKVARVYHASRGDGSRHKFLCRSGSYHGATLAATAATGIPAAREPFAPLPPGFIRVAQPSPGRCGYCPRGGPCTLECAADVERAIEREGPETVAGFIGEPIAFREAIKVPPPGYWPAIREICDRHGILLIVDEVITGFGRTGRFFGLEHWGIEADLVTLAKGLTSGYVPMSACVLSERIGSELKKHPMTHISTYAGHPLACVAALAVLDVLEREGLVERAADLETVVRREMKRLAAAHTSVSETSVCGLLGSIELALADGAEPAEVSARLAHEAYERGLISRAGAEGSEAVLYFYPALVATEDDVAMAFSVFDEVIGELETRRLLA
jgi:adenosylmethionine-8-amino-7-oxononanoate aminotransferase